MPSFVWVAIQIGQSCYTSHHNIQALDISFGVVNVGREGRKPRILSCDPEEQKPSQIV